ncbi:MAG: HAMP domain-containing histidine kinase [Gemmatimonadetes bacterium]|nr:HAMP domain-containing histidine kinase [Gemmatimonadota bacterium]NIS03319.1 HAMP domain-containing histidine kinase [Gemmatimonadota bacterium]NIT69180.1 HAMP domain-containing histidine kinase [Gemmatimonadota bacterium]NIU54572.1 HAMP domain-containing protein [Gemmatimonadota bacterium]NIV25655.1 HAMP domain-containing protein [Gemmatimonadota bacterium]
MSLQRTLLVMIGTALIVGLVPAGIVLDRQIASSLEARAREDLAMAAPLLADREQMTNDMEMMHAKEVAGTAGLAAALERSDRARAVGLVEEAAAAFGGEPLVVGPDGRAWSDAIPPEDMVEETLEGAMPVKVVAEGSQLWRVALAPVSGPEGLLGAVGYRTPVDIGTAGTLAGLIGSEVVILFGRDEHISTAPPEVVKTVAVPARNRSGDGLVHELRSESGRRYLMTAAPLGVAGTVAFVRDLDSELAVLPRLRKMAAVVGTFALLGALALAAMLAAALARPVRNLARAASRLADGDFEAPLKRSAIREIDQVTAAFDEMRRALAARLDEVEAANRELADRQRRLTALQAELIQRDRLAASGRLVTELAHEIRNPVANVRNCLEVIRRRTSDRTGRDFADLAIDELLRMHELAERMLDLNRPGDPDVRECDAATVAREVVALVQAGAADEPLEIELTAEGRCHAAIAPDSLKQVLLNLVQNAREAMEDRGRLELTVRCVDDQTVITVMDDGPGIADEALERIFDPFFTTKGHAHGVGLGLFVAEGIIRRYGGRIVAENRSGGGAVFRIELKPAEEARLGEAGQAGSRPDLEISG